MVRRFSKQEPSATYFLTMIALWLVFAVGWVMNIVAIWNTADSPLTAKFVLRCIGIFAAPIGAILGYI